MRVTIARADLACIIQGTIKAVEARNAITILSHVLLTATDGKLTATATDLDTQITASAAATVESDGETTVNAALLSGIVGKLPANAEILLALDGGHLIVTSGRSRFKLQVLPADDFPLMQPVQYAAEFKIDLHRLVSPIAFAISNETTRYYLCGVYLHTVDGELKAAATDGHRFALNRAPLAAEFDGIIMPAKAVSLVPQGEVAFSVSGTKIKIVAADWEMESKLIDGTYPDYVRIIPTGNDKIITVDNATMRAAADRVATVSQEKSRAVKIAVDAGRVTLSVSGVSGDATEEFECDYAGEAITFGLNSQYLAAEASMFPAGPLTIAVSDGGAPVLFTAPGAPELLGIVMPMRT